MATTQSQLGNTATDIGLLWKAAIEQYEKATKVKIVSLDTANSVDELLFGI